MDNTDNADTLAGALRLIADIRAAAGDPEGKLMQDELVSRIRRMREGLQVTRGLPFVSATRYRNDIRSIAKEALQ
jgi:hypothetical protein